MRPVSYALLWLCACSAAHQVAPPPEPQAPRPEPRAATPMPEPVLHADTRVVDRTCHPGDKEPCDAIDNDCDGAIDEGCGYATGGVQVTVAWDTRADIDLYVRDPSGETLFYNEERRRSPLGGVLDHDARGMCRAEQKLRNVENAYWPAPPPKGRYLVDLHYFGPCGDTAPTEVTLSVAVGGRLMGQYVYTLAPEERVSALEFEVE